MMRGTKEKTKSPAYDPDAAGRFWSRRLKSTDPLAAVLTYNAPPSLNRAYDAWETASLKRLLPKAMRGKTTLDIGCGIGRLSVLLAEAGAAVTALDLSPAMLARCHARARRKRVASRLTTVCGSAHDLSEIESKFDIITCFGLMEHLPPRQRRSCLTEAFDRLKHRGRMFVVVNNQDNVLLRAAYRLKKQKPDGYYVSLVGLDWLEKVCSNRKMSLTLRAANPFYALVHYHVLPNRKLLGVTDRKLTVLCKQACELDLAHPLDGPLSDQLASHFLVEIRHSQAGAVSAR